MEDKKPIPIIIFLLLIIVIIGSITVFINILVWNYCDNSKVISPSPSLQINRDEWLGLDYFEQVKVCEKLLLEDWPEYQGKEISCSSRKGIIFIDRPSSDCHCDVADKLGKNYTKILWEKEHTKMTEDQWIPSINKIEVDFMIK